MNPSRKKKYISLEFLFPTITLILSCNFCAYQFKFCILINLPIHSYYLSFAQKSKIERFRSFFVEKNFLVKFDKPRSNTLRPSAEFRYNRAFCKYRPLFCAAQWDPEVSLVHSVARRSMVAAQQMRSGVSDSRFATRYESRAPTGKIVVDRSVTPAARHGSILIRPRNNLICLLLWECYVRIGGRFLSGPGCLLNSRSNKLEPIDFESLFELEPPLDSSFLFASTFADKCFRFFLL